MAQTSHEILREALVKELLTLSTMTLATSDLDGLPHAAPVYFASDDKFDLYFFSASDSRHGRDLETHPVAAAAIYPLHGDWRTLQGLQLHGTVNRISSANQWQHGWRVYLAKFPFVRQLQAVIHQNSLYCFQTEWLCLIDNRRWFGFKKEWRLNQ